MEMTLELSRKLLQIPPDDLTRAVSYISGMARRSGGRVLPEHYDRALRWLRIDHWLDALAREIGDGDLLPLLTSLRFGLDEMRESGELDNPDALGMVRGALYPLLKRQSEKIVSELTRERAATSDPARKRAIMAELSEHYQTWTEMSEYWKVKA